jgi:hypothetical protein
MLLESYNSTRLDCQLRVTFSPALISTAYFSQSSSFDYNASMNQLDRLEALAQRLIEGTFSRFFQTTAADKEMEQLTDTRESLNLGVNHLAGQWLLQLADRQVRLGEPVLTIGRAMDNDIILSDPTVSRYHAQLRWREGGYHLYPPAVTSLEKIESPASGQAKQPQLSAPHTTVNRRPVVQCALHPGDVITLGETTVKVLRDKPEI